MRLEPVCPVFGRCGGCSWQHLPYCDQLSAKEEIFADLLWRSARVPRERILPIMPAPETFNYRARAQLKIHCSSGEFNIGFFRAGSHFVVNVPGECAIVHFEINRLIAGMRDILPLFPDAARIPQIDVALGDDGRAELIVHYIGDRKDELIRFFRQHGEWLAVDAIFLQSGRKTTLERAFGKEAPQLAYKVPDPFSRDRREIKLSFPSGGFSQINYRQNVALIETVCDWAGLTGRERLLDLFCGNGNFALPLARGALHVTGVEDYRPSIDIAIRNGMENGVNNVSFVCGDATAAVSGMVSASERFDIITLDPPREGSAEVARLIPALGATAIVYVSCDPATLARDIGILKKSGYDVVKSRPVDMFPQTYHIESITLLAPA